MKAVDKYFYEVLFTVLYKLVLTLTFEDEALVCDHTNQSYLAVLSYGTVIMLLTLTSVDETLVCDHANESY